MDFLKEAYEAWSQRVRAPFAGSIILAFAAWNWKPIWYLFASDESAAIRLRFFEQNTDAWSLYGWPVLTGTALVLFLPWLGVVGAICTSRPLGLLKKAQQDAVTNQRVYRFEAELREEEAKEALRNAQVENALRKSAQAQEAAAMGDEKLAESIRAEGSALSEPETIARKLTKMEARVLKMLRGEPDTFVSLNQIDPRHADPDKWPLAFSDRREYLEAQRALDCLSGAELVESKGSDGAQFHRITLKGFEVADYLND